MTILKRNEWKTLLAIFDDRGHIVDPISARSPWSDLINAIKISQIEIFSPSLNHPSSITGVIQNSLRIQKEYRHIFRRRKKFFRGLVIWEPRIIHPRLHSKRYQKKFSQTIVFSPKWAQLPTTKILPWPQLDAPKFPTFEEWQKRSDSFALIQSNKLSVIKGEQYSLRRNVVIQNHPNLVKIYGKGWNENLLKMYGKWIKSSIRTFPKRPTYRSLCYLRTKKLGCVLPVESKSFTYSRHKYALVIENDSTYISEKLFDAVFNGCLTVYIGGDLDQSGINFSPDLVCVPTAYSIQKKMLSVKNLTPELQYKLARDSFLEILPYINGCSHARIFEKKGEIFSAAYKIFYQELI